MNKQGLLWFRNDLRLHDHKSLTEGLAHSDDLILIYIFDPRVFKGKGQYGLNKISPFKTKFIIDSVHELRNSIRACGGELIVRVGHQEDIIFEIAKKYDTRWVYCNRERTQPDVNIQNLLEKKLWTLGCEIKFGRGKMLYHTQDLPFPVSHTPDTFSQFRKEIERSVSVRKPLKAPAKLDSISKEICPGDIPTMKDLGYEDSIRTIVKGGEKEGLRLIDDFFDNNHGVVNYTDYSKRIKKANESMLISPYLAIGCLSSKTVFYKIDQHRHILKLRSAVEFMERNLRLRDFLRLLGKKHNHLIGDINEDKVEQSEIEAEYQILFDNWRLGNTNYELVDALMHSLNKTGFISFRGREFVANFLIHTYQIPWEYGASYFQSMLIDYDPCSNWESWQYLAGSGSAPYKVRNFDPHIHSKRLDPRGEYARSWNNK